MFRYHFPSVRFAHSHLPFGKFSRVFQAFIIRRPGIPGHPIKFPLTNSLINKNGSTHLSCQFHFVNNAIFLFIVTFTLIGLKDDNSYHLLEGSGDPTKSAKG